MTHRSLSKPEPLADTAVMRRRTIVPAALFLSLCSVLLASPAPSTASPGAQHAQREAAARAYRPDGWIKLCGLSTGCTVGPPPPHPWRGNNVYNTTGSHQTVAVRMEDGEGVRFWIAIENDGTQADTIVVQGCRGNRRFVINTVLVGKHKRPDWRAKKVTKAFKAGTLAFSFPPSSTAKRKYLTLNIVAPTTAEGVSYRCPVTIHSEARPDVKDTVVGKMTTF
jgi:hypothetical protein